MRVLRELPKAVCPHPKKTIGVWLPNARGPIKVEYCDECATGYSVRYIAAAAEAARRKR